MVSQQQLRSRQLASGRGQTLQQKTRRASQKRIERKQIQETQIRAQEQKQTISKSIKELQKEISGLKVTKENLNRVKSSTTPIDNRIRGATYKLKQLKELENKLGKGQYYKDFVGTLSKIKEEGSKIKNELDKQYYKAKTDARRKKEAKERAIKKAISNLPEGAKIISTDGGKIEYTLPSSSQQSVSGKSKIPEKDIFGKNIDPLASLKKSYSDSAEKSNTYTNIITGDKISSSREPLNKAYKPDIFGTSSLSDLSKQSKKVSMASETRRYQDLSYNKNQATKLARESARVGGVSFSPDVAERIIKGEKYTSIQNDYNNGNVGGSNRMGLFSSLRGRISGNVVDGSEDYQKEFQEQNREAVISAATEESITQYQRPRNILDIPSNFISSIKEFSERQSALVSAESLLGVGNVVTVDGKETFIDRPISSTMESVGGFFGRGAEEVAYKVYEPQIGSEINYYEPQFGTIQTNPLTGEIVTGEKTRILTQQDVRDISRGIGDATSFGTQAGLWIAGGAPIYGTYLAGDLGRDIAYTKKIKNEPLTSGQKAEIGLNVGFIGFGAGAKGVRYLKEPIVNLLEGGGARITNRWNQFAGMKIRRIKTYSPDNPFFYTEETRLLKSKRGKYILPEKIESPILDLAATESVGRQRGNVLSFKNAKQLQYGNSGQRTIIKEVKGNIFGIDKTKILYEGIPYVQKGAYAKQLNFLSKIYGEKQARNILRFRAPSVVEEYQGGNLFLKNNRATGKFISETRRPVITIDESLGIKTRGGKSIYKIDYVDRIGKGNGKKGIGIEESSSIIKRTPPKQNALDILGFEFKRGFDLTKTKTGEANILGRQFEMENIKSVSEREFLPFDNRVFVDTGKTTILTEIPAEDTVNILRGGGSKSSSKYFQELYNPSLKVAPKPKTIPPKSKETNLNLDMVSPTETKGVSPKIFSLTGATVDKIPESNFFGTGTYERTESIGIISPDTRDVLSLNVKTEPTQRTSQSPRQIEIIKQSPLEIQRDRNIPKQLDFIKSSDRTIFNEATKIDQATKTKQALNQMLELRQAQKTNLLQRQRTSSRKKITNPKVKTPKIKIPFTSEGKTSTKSILEEFKIFARKKGKDIEIGEAKTREEAFGLLGKELKKTLRASGFVKRGGEKIKPISFGEEFRASKKDPFRVVERKSKRLRKGTTGKEIQFFRKQKTKRKGGGIL